MEGGGKVIKYLKVRKIPVLAWLHMYCAHDLRIQVIKNHIGCQ